LKLFGQLKCLQHFILAVRSKFEHNKKKVFDFHKNSAIIG
jgi:hypothetical protein